MRAGNDSDERWRDSGDCWAQRRIEMIKKERRCRQRLITKVMPLAISRREISRSHQSTCRRQVIMGLLPAPATIAARHITAGNTIPSPGHSFIFTAFATRSSSSSYGPSYAPRRTSADAAHEAQYFYLCSGRRVDSSARLRLPDAATTVSTACTSTRTLITFACSTWRHQFLAYPWQAAIFAAMRARGAEFGETIFDASADFAAAAPAHYTPTCHY